MTGAGTKCCQTIFIYVGDNGWKYSRSAAKIAPHGWQTSSRGQLWHPWQMLLEGRFKNQPTRIIENSRCSVLTNSLARSIFSPAWLKGVCVDSTLLAVNHLTTTGRQTKLFYKTGLSQICCSLYWRSLCAGTESSFLRDSYFINYERQLSPKIQLTHSLSKCQVYIHIVKAEGLNINTIFLKEAESRTENGDINITTNKSLWDSM